MANVALFKSKRGAKAPNTDTFNEAGGTAYSYGDKQALAQFAVTGCLNTTYYVGAKAQLDTVLALCKNLDAEFIAKTAVYARQKGYMKDMPALLCAALAVKGLKGQGDSAEIDNTMLRKIFFQVIDNGKMLRNFVQIMRSGATGRKSLGTGVLNLVRDWLNFTADDHLFRSCVGQNPTMADIIKMAHPRPKDKSRSALYKYILGKGVDEDVCGLVKHYESFKAGEIKEVPDVPFQMLDSLGIGDDVWTEIAKNAPWHMTRMNLNTFVRHGVFKNEGMTEMIADRLRDRQMIARSRVFPYQLLAAYKNINDDVPHAVAEALQDAMEISIDNVPVIEGNVVVCPDVSGSMNSAVTGQRRGSTSKVRCVDIAALVSAAILRNNGDAKVLPFDSAVRDIRLNPRDTVMTNAAKLASLCGGATRCSAPLKKLNEEKAKVDVLIFISDYESWVDSLGYYGRRAPTSMLEEWNILKSRNPKAKLICIDLTPSDSTQVKDHKDILQVGGFSDTVFSIVSEFINDRLTPDNWVGLIEGMEV